MIKFLPLTLLSLFVLSAFFLEPGSSYGGGGRRRNYEYSFRPSYENDDFQYGVEGDTSDESSNNGGSENPFVGSGNPVIETGNPFVGSSLGGATDPYDYYRSNKQYLKKKQKRKHLFGTGRSHVFDFGPDTKKLYEKFRINRRKGNEFDE